MSRFIAGLSRGLANDYTTLAVVETFGEYQINKRYDLRFLERFKGISSEKLVEQVMQFINKKCLKENISIVLDTQDFEQTLFDRFTKAKLHFIRVTVTGNDPVTTKEAITQCQKKN